jgi:hypothetical protein
MHATQSPPQLVRGPLQSGDNYRYVFKAAGRPAARAANSAPALRSADAPAPGRASSAAGWLARIPLVLPDRSWPYIRTEPGDELGDLWPVVASLADSRLARGPLVGLVTGHRGQAGASPSADEAMRPHPRASPEPSSSRGRCRQAIVDCRRMYGPSGDSGLRSVHRGLLGQQAVSCLNSSATRRPHTRDPSGIEVSLRIWQRKTHLE